MRLTMITIDGIRYDLAQPADAGALQASIVDILQHGPGFIDLDLPGDRTISTLVSPAFGITVETRDIPDEDARQGDTGAWFDFNQFDFTGDAISDVPPLT